MIGGDRWDAVVVGAGPAGSAFAARMAALSHRVLILDREHFPRDKPCGECLSPGAVAELASLGALPEITAAASSRLLGWRIHAPGGDHFRGDFHPPNVGLAIRRSTLDNLLLERAARAGATVRTGERVMDLIREGERVVGVRLKGGEQIRARVVIGADGIRSVVLRRLELVKRKPRLLKLALTAHLGGITGLGEHGELHVRRWGCIGIAPLGDGLANVTVVLADGQAPRAAGSRDGFFDGTTQAEDRLAGAARESEVLATGPFDWPVRSAVADGAMLIGDASGYYDPFTGQGIFRALKGAALAADVANEAIRTDDPSKRALARYDRARRKAFGSGEKLQHLIEAVVSRPAVMDGAVRVLRASPWLADTLVAVAGDVRPRREKGR